MLAHRQVLITAQVYGSLNSLRAGEFPHSLWKIQRNGCRVRPRKCFQPLSWSTSIEVLVNPPIPARLHRVVFRSHAGCATRIFARVGCVKTISLCASRDFPAPFSPRWLNRPAYDILPYRASTARTLLIYLNSINFLVFGWVFCLFKFVRSMVRPPDQF